MKLIHANASPFVRKVHIVLEETGLIEKTTLIPVATTPVNSADQAVAANPSGKIPALILDDGSTLYDSRVICRYLNDRAGAALYPADTLWKTLTLEAHCDAIMDACVLMTYERRVRPEDMVYTPWIEAQWAKADRSIRALDAEWMDLLRGPLSIGQIAAACALGYVDFRHGDRDWRRNAPALADWFSGFGQRRSMAVTQPD